MSRNWDGKVDCLVVFFGSEFSFRVISFTGRGNVHHRDVEAKT